MENIKRQVSDIKSPQAEVKARVNREAKDAQTETKEYHHQRNNTTPFFHKPHKTEAEERRRKTSPTPHQCQYCVYDHRKGHDYSAFGKRCSKCNKKSFFISMQISSQLESDSQKKGTGQNNQRRRIKRTTEEDSSICSDDDYFVQAVTNSFQAKKITGAQKRKQTVTVRLNDVDIRMERDSGDEVNLMAEH
ncbi:Hypothetical predicted protein [Paramuricea clavata]|uniref:Uncharacterized protein n=1 Tax=Paramuricea clavata TaxID=317549 RepID=A0A7D9HC54_PARCT|nr:Hypothetical predicted protein [Paramuricea clavata]